MRDIKLQNTNLKDNWVLLVLLLIVITNATIMKIPTGITFPLLLKRNILLNQPAGSNADGQDTPNPPDNKEPRPRLIIHVQRDAKNGGKSITATK